MAGTPRLFRSRANGDYLSDYPEGKLVCGEGLLCRRRM